MRRNFPNITQWHLVSRMAQSAVIKHNVECFKSSISVLKFGGFAPLLLSIEETMQEYEKHVCNVAGATAAALLIQAPG